MKATVIGHRGYTPGWQVLQVKVGGRIITIHFDPTAAKPVELTGDRLAGFHSATFADVKKAGE